MPLHHFRIVSGARHYRVQLSTLSFQISQCPHRNNRALRVGRPVDQADLERPVSVSFGCWTRQSDGHLNPARPYPFGPNTASMPRRWERAASRRLPTAVRAVSATGGTVRHPARPRLRAAVARVSSLRLCLVRAFKLSRRRPCVPVYERRRCAVVAAGFGTRFSQFGLSASEDRISLAVCVWSGFDSRHVYTSLARHFFQAVRTAVFLALLTVPLATVHR